MVFQIAFGTLKMDYSTFESINPREFFCSWTGHQEQLIEDRETLFWLFKYNALRTTWSGKQARQIQRDKSPWGQKQRQEDISQGGIKAILNFVSK